MIAFLDQIKAAANAKGLDPRLVAAVVQCESAGDPWTPRYEPGWHTFLDVDKYAKGSGVSSETERVMQAMSWGLMHIMGTCAREFGFKGPLPRLCIPQEGLLFGTTKLKVLIDKYGIQNALIAYNAGNPDNPRGIAYQKKVITAWDAIRF